MFRNTLLKFNGHIIQFKRKFKFNKNNSLVNRKNHFQILQISRTHLKIKKALLKILRLNSFGFGFNLIRRTLTFLHHMKTSFIKFY